MAEKWAAKACYSCQILDRRDIFGSTSAFRHSRFHIAIPRHLVTSLLYIGGYGRSGSTLLEVLLAASAEVVACGEIVIAARRRDAPRCSCGKTREACPVWGALFTESHPPGSWRHRDLVSAVLDHVNGHYALMINSSKTAWGSFRTPFALRKMLGEGFSLIHLVRDPHGVCWSSVTGKRRRRGRRLPDIQNSPRRYFRHMRSVLGWWAANLPCELFAWRHPKHYVLVRYEDLVDAPERTLARIFAKLQLGEAPKLGGTNDRGNRHQLFGNRVRFLTTSRDDIRPDTRWKTEMKPIDRGLISVLSWPLRSRYGY